MKKLRDIRVKRMLTQQGLAERLGVSQQTVARWETTTGSIPAKHLRDLAVTLGARVQDFVDDNSGKERALRAAFDEDDDRSTPYGTVIIKFERKGADEGTDHHWHSYPVTHGQRGELRRQMLNSAVSGEEGMVWLSFETLDGLWVIVNVAELESVKFESDAVEEMSLFAHEEVYELVRDLGEFGRANEDDADAEGSKFSKKLLEEAKAVIEAVGGPDKAEERYNAVTFEYRDGRTEIENVSSRETFEHLQEVFDGSDVNPNTLIDLKGGNYHESETVRIAAYRLIEVPLALMDAVMAEESEDEAEHG